MLTYHKVTGHKVGVIDTDADIKIRNNHELRWYDDGNYIGFEAPALSADQIWTLPSADGTSGQVLRTSGSGVLSWASAAAGESGVWELDDDDDSHTLTGVWNEAETVANRSFNFLVHAGDRTIDLYENFKILDGTDIELHGSGGEKVQLAIDTQNAERTLNLTGNLTLSGNNTVAAWTVTGTTTLATALTGVLRGDSGVVSVDSDVTDLVSAASTTAAGKVELAIGSEVNTGTSTTLAVTPDALDDWTGGTNLATLGTITTGTWNAGGITASAASTFNNTVTVGSDGTGHDVKLYSATASSYWLWDEDADSVVQAMVAGNTTGNEYAYTINVTDATTASQDMHKGLQVAYAQSGAKTGTAHVEGIGSDITITNDIPEVYAFAAYLTANSRDDDLGNVGGMDIYMEDMGNDVANLWGLCIGINGTNQAATRHCGLEIRTHGGTIKDAILLTSAAVDGIDMSGSTFSTADLVLQNSATIKNTSSSLIEFSKQSKFAETVCFDAVQTATGDATTTIDWGLGNIFYFTFGAANETFTFTAPSGPAKLVLVLKQDGSGSRTATWPGTVLWPGNVAPTLTTTAAYVDIVTLMWDGTNYFGLFNGDFR